MKSAKLIPRERRIICYGVNVLPPGSLVRITSYSPFRGLKGTIRIVDTIIDDLEEPFCYYLIELDGRQSKEPIWFEYDEVEVITSPLVAPKYLRN